MKKFIIIFISILFFQITKAQNEFITIWQPGLVSNPATSVEAPFQANTNQIWFPGNGDNYTIEWEEVGFPQHNGIMTNVTSTNQVLIDFGIPNTDFSSATYRVKVSNGNGIFRQIKFGSAQLFPAAEMLFPTWTMYGSADKITEIEQWGNISWASMNSAFTNCRMIQLTATDSPNLNTVTDLSFMFYGTPQFTGASSMQNWNTSLVQNFRFMFSCLTDTSTIPHQFNSPYIGNWDTSSATNMSYMLAGRTMFNQSVNNWDVSNVTDMSWMFGQCMSFNQPLNNWDTSSLQDMHFMFHMIPVFNQPLNNWNTSNVTDMAHVFHGCSSFNQNINSWDVSNVKDLDIFLAIASSFNQSLEDWNLASITDAQGMLNSTGINCENYSKTIAGWAENPNTANNINLGMVAPATYASNAVSKRNILINKGWTITGDTVGNCFLATSEIKPLKNGTIYPNPAKDNIHTDHVRGAEKYRIVDASGRLIKEGNIETEMINVSLLPKGNYILQVVMKDKIQSFKFIKE